MPRVTSYDALRGDPARPPTSAWPLGWDGKNKIMQGGPAIRVRRYQRASHDPYGTQASITTQDRENGARITAQRWTEIGSFTDNDRPASRKHRKEGSRPDYERMLAEMRSDPGDVLVLWEMARGQRDLAVYVAMRDLCLENGPFYWMVGGNLYDLRNRNDKQQLNAMASQAEGGSDTISEAVLAGLDSQAKDGRPHGQTPFGYRRIYNPSSRKYQSQIPDEEDRGGWNAADTVRWIFKSYIGGVPMQKIVDELNAQGIPTPREYAAIRQQDGDRIERWRGSQWRQAPVYNILKNFHYLGVRMHKEIMAKEGCWDALVSQEDFFTAQKLMERRAYAGDRPAQAQSLLTCLARCGACGDHMIRQTWARQPSRPAAYRCRRGDSSVPQGLADLYVLSTITSFLISEDTAALLRVDTSEEVSRAAAKADKWRTELAWWKQHMEDEDRPDITREDYDRQAMRLLPKIREADERARSPKEEGLKPFLGGEGAAKFARLDMARQRELLKASVDIRVYPVGRGKRKWNIEDRLSLDFSRMLGV